MLRDSFSKIGLNSAILEKSPISGPKVVQQEFENVLPFPKSDIPEFSIHILMCVLFLLFHSISMSLYRIILLYM